MLTNLNKSSTLEHLQMTILHNFVYGTAGSVLHIHTVVSLYV